MLTIDRQPPLPELPQFSREMAAFLAAAAASHTVRRPRRVRTFTVAAVAAAVVVIIVIVGVAVARGPGSKPGPGRSPGPARLASFSVRAAPGGLVTLTLTPGQLRDPDALRQALAKVGVPALVTADKVCYVPGPNAILTQVLSPPQHHPDGSTVWRITPSAIPDNVELSIGYYHVPQGFGIHVTVVPEHTTLTCTSGAPAPPHR
jgi:hypothetical protein